MWALLVRVMLYLYLRALKRYVTLCLRYMLTALLYLAGVLVALYATQSRDMTHCVIALLLLFVGGCVYLIISDKKLEGLSFRQKVQLCVTYMKAYPGLLLTRAKYRLLGLVLGLGLVVVSRVAYAILWWGSLDHRRRVLFLALLAFFILEETVLRPYGFSHLEVLSLLGCLICFILIMYF